MSRTSPYENQGTSLSVAERRNLGLTGLMPAAVDTLDIQKRRVLQHLRSRKTMLDKYVAMAHLRTTNIRLFYKVVMDELEEFAPIIYTPTVGTACLEYSNLYPLAGPGVPDGLYLTDTDFATLCNTIKNYQSTPDFEPEVAVISDGSRILGLGDLGVDGMPIPIGKLQLYVAGAGIDPRRTLPILLDLGTNNEKLRTSEFYLGLRQPRPNDEQFYAIVDKVLKALRTVYPNMFIQFEDWSSEHAFELLSRYQNKMLCFNDDIQGTGAVILAGVINAIRRVEQESGILPSDHRVVFYGAGSAGIGVARQIQDYFQYQLGMSEQEAQKLFWIVDSKGLVTLDRGDKLAQHKVYYARKDNQGKQYKKLMDIIDYIRPTMLIGLSSIPGAFTKDVLRRMAELNKQPIVFPLSNPATKAECTFEDAMQATENRVIFASGTAFPPYTIPGTNDVRIPAQGNNMYIFPGLGLGAVAAKPAHISNAMVYATAKALAESLTPEERKRGWLYPSLQRIRSVSANVAAALCLEAKKEGLVRAEAILNATSYDQLVQLVEKRMWWPQAKLENSKI